MVSMGLMIGVRLIEGGKSKKVVIISEIRRRRNVYPCKARKVRTSRRLKRWWCHRSKTNGSCAWDKTGDELSGEATDVEELSTSSR